MFVRLLRHLHECRMTLEKQEQRRGYERRKWNPLQNQALRTLPQRAAVVSHEPRSRGAQDLLASWKKWRKLLEHAALWHGADDLVLQFAICEQQHGGNAHHVEAPGDIAVVVNVQLRNGDLCGVLTCNLFEDGRNLLARSAPLSPEVNKDWLVR
jgi:hypothetical protein